MKQKEIEGPIDAMNEKIIELIKQYRECKQMYLNQQEDRLYNKWEMNEFNGKLESDFEVARKFGKKVLDNALSIKLPPRHVLNVNFPSVDISKVRGIQAAVLDSHKMSDQIVASKNPNFYSIGPINQRLETSPKSDRFYLENGSSSVHCENWSKKLEKEYGWGDKLKVRLTSEEFMNFLFNV